MRAVDKARVGKNIRAARERAGMTVEELAAKAGITAWCIYDYESKSPRSVPRLDTALILADTLGITLNDLIGEQVVVDVRL